MDGIEEFRIDIPQAELDDLRDRLARTRWPDQLPGVGWDYGIALDDVRELAEYWRTGYDWRVHERRLNGFPQFITEIDGQAVHFLHVRSHLPGALPLIMTHGWPGSIVEFIEIIGPLTDPGAHGGDPADAFHMIVPSIPGFGFSGPTRDRGWNVQRVARAWDELMRRLGYQRYGAQGGDWGSSISRELGVIAPDHVAGVHLNMLSPYVARGSEPAVPRLMAMWDSILLAYADRGRVIPPAYQALVTRTNGDVLPTVLVDGYVAGVWRAVREGIEVTAFHPLPGDTWQGLAREARALVPFLAARDPEVYRRYHHWWARLPRAEVRLLPGSPADG